MLQYTENILEGASQGALRNGSAICYNECMMHSYTMEGTSHWAGLGSLAISQELWNAYSNPVDPFKPRIVRIENVEDQPLYQKKDIDLLVHSYRPRTMDSAVSSIEIKADTYAAGDFPGRSDQGNFFFELVSNDTRNPRTPGCFVYCEADHFYYLFLATGTLYTFDCKALQQSVLKRIGFDAERFLNDPRSLTDIRMPGLKHTSTRIGGIVRYRTWGVALPIAQVLRWAREDGVRVQKRSMINQVHSAACQMGMEQAFLDKVPLEIRRRLPGLVSAAPSPMQQPVRVSRPNPQGMPMAA